MTISLPKKTIAVGLAIAVAFSLTGFALVFPVAYADDTTAHTIEQLQDQIDSLQAQLAALGGGGGGVCFAFTRDLFNGVGSGTDVTALQDYLTGTGHFTFSGGSTGFFGPITQTAVAAWQSANGVSPPAGYFGPISRAMYNSVCTPGDGDGDGGDDGAPTADLSGGAGSADYQLTAGLSSEEVGEDEVDQDVVGLEIQARGSDIEVRAVRLVFVQSTGATADFEDYASEVSVSLGGTELARVPATNFNDENTWSSTVTLASGGVIREDDKEDLVVSISGASNIDTNDQGDSWTVDFRSLRYVDAQGASISEDPGTATRSFSFETFATASGSELRITEADNDAINKAHLVNVHATENTDDVVLLDFLLENRGTSDFTYREFGALITTSATPGDVDNMIAGGSTPDIELILDGQAYGTASYQDDGDGVSVGTAEDVLWDDVDFVHPAGTTVSAQIRAKLLALDTAVALGDTIFATVGETETDQTALVDVRDESNTQLADVDIIGSATGEANELRDVGFDIALVGTPTAVKTTGNASSGTSDSGLFTIVFDVTAWDGDIFIDKTAPTRIGGIGGSGTESDLNTSASSGTLTSTITSPSGATEGSQSFTVSQDETERFTITTHITDGPTDDLADNFLDVSLTELLYALTNVDGTLGFTFDLGDFKTPQIFLDDLE